MDSSTLESLVQAYRAGPSEALAKILVLAYIEHADIKSAVSYFTALGNNIPINDFSTIVSNLVGDEYDSTLKAFLAQQHQTDSSAVFTHLIEQGKREQADKLYQVWGNHNNDIRSEYWDKQFEPEAGPSPVKLRIVEKQDIAAVTDLARYQQSVTTFADVVGLEHIKKQIYKKIIMPFQKPSLFQRFKKKAGGGVLLYGPPGCGKTLLARATAGECKAAFFNVEVSDVLDMYIGESEQKLRAIFEKARAETPSVLFFDELEALAGKREHTRNSTTSNMVSQFLIELDGFSQNNASVLVLASTNVPWSVDAAFLRPGRFDRMFFVPPPDKEARASILQHSTKGRPLEDNIDFALLAAKTSGYSGADLANVVEMAADQAIDESLIREQDVNITFDHFKEALHESRSTTTEWLTTARNYARYANDGGRYNDVMDFLKKHGK